ncbi:MAG TPA: hypothetical protein VLX68_10185 [Chitinivibrionales bacterium]|nr:hypothetical protein [Chitinivibrionales bacterium]
MKKKGLFACGIACAAVLFTNCTTGTIEPHPGATLRIDNNSTGDIGWVYMSTSSTSIGTNRIEGVTIPAGTVYDITKLAPGYYDVRAVHTLTFDTAWTGATLTAGTTYTWSISNSDFYGGLQITNSSSYTFVNVYLSQDNTTWGSDWLGNNSIAPNSSYTIPSVPRGYVNMKVVTSASDIYCLQLLDIPDDGSLQIELYNSDFLTTPNGSLKVVNNSSSLVEYLYMRATGTTTWSGDQLGTASIYPGDQYQINGIAPGMYDFRVEDSYQTYSAEIDSQSVSAGQLLSWKVSALN